MANLVFPSQPVTMASTHIRASSGVFAANTKRRDDAMITIATVFFGGLCLLTWSMKTSWISGKKTTPLERFSCLSLNWLLLILFVGVLITHLNHCIERVYRSNRIHRFCHRFHGRRFLRDANFVSVPRIEVDVSTSCCSAIAQWPSDSRWNLRSILLWENKNQLLSRWWMILCQRKWRY